jgi:hypothetical protein
MRPRHLSGEHGCYQRVILPLFDAPAATPDEQMAASVPCRRPLSPNERKRHGLERAVASSPFLADSLSLVPQVVRLGEILLGEDVRVRLEARGVKPRSRQGWGALVSTLVRRGVLRETGLWRQMRQNRGGSRRTPEYQVVRVQP